ncbi:MAG: anti-sigma factor [Nocardioides sp.]
MSNDIHALSGAYAVDALDEFEQLQFERHLAGCSDCTAEVASLREAASLTSTTVAVTPPAHLRAAVLAEIATVRPLAPMVSTLPMPSNRRRFPALVAAAAALIAIGGVGATIIDPFDDGASQSQLTASELVLRADDAERQKHTVDGTELTVVRSKSLDAAVVVTNDMPAAPDGHTYELWLIKNGDTFVPAGQMAGGSTTVLLEGSAADASGIGVTIEKAGAEPTRPNLEAVVTQVQFPEA